MTFNGFMFMMHFHPKLKGIVLPKTAHSFSPHSADRWVSKIPQTMLEVAEVNKFAVKSKYKYLKAFQK